MCGVAAVYAYSETAPAVDQAELRAVRDHMARRGPDGSGEWFSADGRVGLGHRRLSIIDLSDRAAQPMASADGHRVVSFNGEIYNYRELRAELQAVGRVFTTESDTEVLLQLYDQYGTGMLDKLRGMFALTLWDGHRRALLLARDPFGIKPLYYADNGATLRVASQVKALLQAPVDTAPEPAGHAGFFLWGSVPGPWTLYRGIRNLAPGHFMWAGEKGAEQPRPYCLIDAILAQASNQPAQGSQEEALEAISAALQSSVQAHLVADVPVGVFLSAGLDSAMICALAAAAGGQRRTLTLAFDQYQGTAQDERPLAESLARQLQTQHSTVTLRRRDFEGERDQLLAAMDQPSIDGVNTWFVARAAAAQGIKVALSGLGGDELFASYPSFRDVPRITRLAGPLSRVAGLGLFARRLSAPLVSRLTSPKYAGLLEYGGSTGGAYLLRRGLYMPWELPGLMDPDMARAGWAELQTLARLDHTTAGIAAAGASRLAVSALELSWYLRNQLLRDADWAGMAHSLEIRVPLVDLALLRSVAPWFAAHPGISRRQVAAAAAPALPRGLLDRPKSGFTVPIRDWLAPPPASAGRGLRGWAAAVHRQYCGENRPAPASPRLAARRPRVLVSTLAPGTGGVSAMTGFVVRSLAARGLEPVVAHYAPYRSAPELSVPSFRLLQRRTSCSRSVADNGVEIHAIGAWLPELEFTHYAATHHWKQLMESCDAFVAASGNVLAATPFWQTGRPYLAWVATDWEGDRRDRVKSFSLLRRLLDRGINSPVIRRLEKKLLNAGRILSLSEHTAAQLAERAGPGFCRVTLPVAVDTELFAPDPSARVAGRLGFAGRFNDPRKNIGLLLEALAQLRADGHDASVVLMGDSPLPSMARLIARLGLGSYVSFKPGLSRTELRDWMQTLDLFVLPSHQEGLCIAALEALACGVPVVSTRCGGPQEFVIPGLTGTLVASDPREMADAIASIISDPELRQRMAGSARRLVQQRYTSETAEATFAKAFNASFPGLGHGRPAPPLPATGPQEGYSIG